MHRLIDDLLEAPAVLRPSCGTLSRRWLRAGARLRFHLAADDAVFGLPEIALGVFPPAASALLPLRVGVARATRAVITGENRTVGMARRGPRRVRTPAARLEAEIERWFALHLAPRSAVALRHAAPPPRRGTISPPACARCCPNSNGYTWTT